MASSSTFHLFFFSLLKPLFNLHSQTIRFTPRTTFVCQQTPNTQKSLQQDQVHALVPALTVKRPNTLFQFLFIFSFSFNNNNSGKNLPQSHFISALTQLLLKIRLTNIWPVNEGVRGARERDENKTKIKKDRHPSSSSFYKIGSA